MYHTLDKYQYQERIPRIRFSLVSRNHVPQLQPLQPQQCGFWCSGFEIDALAEVPQHITWYFRNQFPELGLESNYGPTCFGCDRINGPALFPLVGRVTTMYSVRSAIHKHWTGRLVLEWVTIWESRLLYVFCLFACCVEHARSPTISISLRSRW